MSKEVTLDDLVKSTNNIKSARPISTSEIQKNMQKQHPEMVKHDIVEDAPLVKNAFRDMEKTIKEKHDYMENVVMPIVMENAREIEMENEINEIDNNDSSNSEYEINDINIEDGDGKEKEEIIEYIAPNNSNEYNIIENDDNKDITVNNDKNEYNNYEDLDNMINDLDIDDDIEEENTNEEESTEELRARFKESLASVKITRDSIDLSKFTISKEPISSLTLLKNMPVTTKKRCDWALVHTGRNMTFEECSGPELDALKKTISNSNGINSVVASLRFVYNHIIDANKRSFEEWCKSIRTEDVESLYFGMYKACYSDANLVARADVGNKGCKKTSLIDTPIDDMVKYENDDAKNEFNAIINSDSTTFKSTIKSNMMVISDKLAVSYTDPTLYSTFIQYASLKPEIVEKYSELLNTMAYIDGFYEIDIANNTLRPIAIKEYKNNINKTVLSKLKTYTEILKTLSNDQYNIMLARLDNIITNPKISYVYPKSVCPECGNEIPEENIDSMLNLLFTRAQLVQVKSL